MSDAGRGTPEITYPCRWGYRVVGVSEADLRALIALVCGDADHVIHGVQPSRAGTYVSVHVSITVRDEAHRTGVYHSLAQDAAVKVVL